jgi:hypothetical protein
LQSLPRYFPVLAIFGTSPVKGHGQVYESRCSSTECHIGENTVDDALLAWGHGVLRRKTDSNDVQSESPSPRVLPRRL